jgi:hypothetical protein
MKKTANRTTPAIQTELEELLTTEEVAQLIKTTPQYLQDLRARGLGPAWIKLSPGKSGRVRYKKPIVAAWMASLTQVESLQREVA